MIRVHGNNTATNFDAKYKMPNRPDAVIQGYRKSDSASPQLIELNNNVKEHSGNENFHLPQIRNETPIKQGKSSRFFKFSGERNFTDNLLSFFTGNKDRELDRANQGTQDSTIDTTARNFKDRPETRRNTLPRRNDGPNASNVHNSNRTPIHASLRRTDKTMISVATKNETFRSVTASSQKHVQNGHAAHIDDVSDIGGYENMFKTRQSTGKCNISKKRSLEVSEYLRRENYKYNERTAKQFLFQKWLKSTEMELPDHHLIETNRPIVSK